MASLSHAGVAKAKRWSSFCKYPLKGRVCFLWDPVLIGHVTFTDDGQADLVLCSKFQSNPACRLAQRMPIWQRCCEHLMLAMPTRRLTCHLWSERHSMAGPFPESLYVVQLRHGARTYKDTRVNARKIKHLQSFACTLLCRSDRSASLWKGKWDTDLQIEGGGIICMICLEQALS